MKIALCSTSVPFVRGGYRNIVDWLAIMLERHGHQVEVVYLPQVDDPAILFEQISAFRWIDLSSADRVVCFRPHSYVIEHDHKIIWFIHHLRGFFDLWGTPYGVLNNTARYRGMREVLREIDNRALHGAKAVFTNSQIVGDRLRTYNGVDSEVLYPPVLDPERFRSAGYNDEIAYVCRLEEHKRQDLLIEAMQYTDTPVKLRLCGSSHSAASSEALAQRVLDLGLSHRVTVDARWISEAEKVEILGSCLAAAYLPFDEDSYGYPSIEASLSSKAILTCSDSGGVMELVTDGYNGVIADPNPRVLAEALDRLYLDREDTQRMGQHARQRLEDLDISWDHVVERLTS